VNAVARPSRPTGDHEDAHVNSWKDAWEAGAESAWTVGPVAVNPYTQDDPVRANAWSAGAQWARGHADRREPGRVRLAHPLRRRTDAGSRFRRMAKAGGVGLSVLAFVGWRWRRSRVRDQLNPTR
jgi:hypothetical protein